MFIALFSIVPPVSGASPGGPSQLCLSPVSCRKPPKPEDRPGVTRTKQWVPVDQSLELLDTPGMLWPKFEDPEVGFRLACTGAVKDEIMDLEELACRLMAYLGAHYVGSINFLRRDKSHGPGLRLRPDLVKQPVPALGRNLLGVVKIGQLHTGRMARILLDEFRGGKLGRFTLELPEDWEGRHGSVPAAINKGIIRPHRQCVYGKLHGLYACAEDVGSINFLRRDKSHGPGLWMNGKNGATGERPLLPDGWNAGAAPLWRGSTAAVFIPCTQIFHLHFLPNAPGQNALIM